MRRGRASTVLLGVWLTTMWVLLWGEATAGNVVGGALAASLVLVAFPPLSVTPGRAGFRPWWVVRQRHDRPVPARAPRRGGFRPWWVVRLVVWFAGALVVSSVTVALAVVDPRGPRRQQSGIVAVPLRTASRRLATVVANLITLTPGTLTVDARSSSEELTTETGPRSSGPDGGSAITLFVHALSLDRPEEVRADVAAIEELVVRALGSATEVARLDRVGEEAP